MVRGKVEMKKIEKSSSRHATFTKRKGGLVKKAHELSVLCDAEVAVILFSNTGNLFEFSSTSVKHTVERYQKCLQSIQSCSQVGLKSQNNDNEAEAIKKEIEDLKSKQMRILGKDLSGLSFTEVHKLDQMLNEGLLSIKDRKEKILMEQLEQSRAKEQRFVMENQNLRKEIDELRSNVPVPASACPVAAGYLKHEAESSKSASSGLSQGKTCKSCVESEDPMTTLQLCSPSYDCYLKRKSPEGETDSSTSESDFDD